MLLTHHHEDHVAGLGRIRETFPGIPIYAPRELVPYIRELETVTPMRHGFWGQAESFPDLLPFDPGESFREGQLLIESVPTPGHCPGHTAFVVRADGRVHVISGDLYIRRKPLSIWYQASAEDAVASCRKLAALADEIVLYPSHLDPIPDGSTRLRAQADWIEAEAAKLREAAQRLGSRDPATLARELYGPLTPAEHASRGEITSASFVRSVLGPTKSLPIDRIAFPEGSF